MAPDWMRSQLLGGTRAGGITQDEVGESVSSSPPPAPNSSRVIVAGIP